VRSLDDGADAGSTTTDDRDGSPMSIRLLVVDDHASFRTAVTEMVATDERFELVGSVDSAEAAVELAGSTSCDLVMMDVRMPGMDGLAAAVAVRRLQPDVVVVLVSTGDLDPARAAAVGATFVPKVSLTAAALVDAWSDAGHDGTGGGDDALPA
jgi:DNA-binding NarL/FixJ family response regulator